MAPVVARPWEGAAPGQALGKRQSTAERRRGQEVPMGLTDREIRTAKPSEGPQPARAPGRPGPGADPPGLQDRGQELVRLLPPQGGQPAPDT